MSENATTADTNDPPRGRDWAEQLMEEAVSAVNGEIVSVTPTKALELYLDDKERECSITTVRSHRSRLGMFVDWCDDNDIDELRELTGQDLLEYRHWRRDDGDLSPSSEKTQMDTLRVFLRWCETIDAVRPGLPEKVRSPTLGPGQNERDRMLDPEAANHILEYLDTYEYASRDHVVWLVLTSTGMRLGALHGLDVDDLQADADPPHVTLRHRPETGTPLKNGRDGERSICLSRPASAVIADYIADKRPGVTDEHGREPLLATTNGRVAKNTIRKIVYRWSRPCATTDSCPHDRDPTECDAARRINDASKCPTSLTPHPIRRTYITQELQADVPVDVVSDRCNVSPAVIDAHYDQRSETEKMRHRRRVLDKARSEEGPFTAP